MKPARIVWLFWLGNVVLLASVGIFMWHQGSSLQSERDANRESTAEIKTRQPRIEWKPPVEKPAFTVVDTRLSPIERPKDPERIVDKPPPPQPPPKTDEQLKAELEAELRKRFKVMRVMLSGDAELESIAIVVGDTTRLQWFTGMNLQQEYGDAKSAALRKLALDATVLAIDAEGVLLDAASLEKPEKRFEIRLELSESPALTGGKLLLYFVEPTAAEDHTTTEDWKSYWDSPPKWPGEPVPPHQFGDLSDHFERVDGGLKVVKPLAGIPFLGELKLQEGDIMRSVNAQALESLSDFRRIVREEYTAGAEEFTVTYERDGVSGATSFRAPKKRDEEGEPVRSPIGDSPAEKAHRWGYPMPRDK